MIAAMQPGTHTTHPTWSRISDSLNRSPTQIAPVAKSLHLRPCHLLYEQHGTTRTRLVFACDYRDSNGLGQLKESDRLSAYVPELSHCTMTDLTHAQYLQLQIDSTTRFDNTEQTELAAPTAHHTEQRHLYAPLMGAPREWQVVHGTTPTALLAGTTKVSAHLASTPHARLNARDRK